MDVAVIGAGPSGVMALRHLLGKSGIRSVVAYERAGQAGGLWVYTDNTGTDSDGLPVHQAVFRGMRYSDTTGVLRK